METKWSSAKRFVLDFTANRYEASNSYIALRRFGGSCSSSLVGSEERPAVDWPPTRYFLGPWQLSGGADNQPALRAALDAIQPGGAATMWAAVEDAIAYLARGPANLGKARRQLVVIYSADAIDTCHQFALDRLAAEMGTGDIKLIPISLGESSSAPDNINSQVIELARRIGVQVTNPSSQAQLNQALQTALPVPTVTTTPLASPTSRPAASPTASVAATFTSAPMATLTVRPTASLTSRPAATVTALPTASPTPRPAASLTAVPATSPTPRPSSTPLASPTTTPTPRPTAPPTTLTATRPPGP
jgi:hypothetical protein